MSKETMPLPALTTYDFFLINVNSNQASRLPWIHFIQIWNLMWSSPSDFRVIPWPWRRFWRTWRGNKQKSQPGLWKTWRMPVRSAALTVFNATCVVQTRYRKSERGQLDRCWIYSFVRISFRQTRSSFNADPQCAGVYPGQAEFAEGKSWRKIQVGSSCGHLLFKYPKPMKLV